VNIQTNRFLSEFSTFGIGGPIRYFLEASSLDEMRFAFRWAQAQGISTLIVGKGSNSLFSDDPYPGLVILNKIDFCQFEGNEVEVGSGFSFSLLGVQTARKGLSGLEFACGIPATVGGAVFMNAGANGKETSQSLISVQYLERSGDVKVLPIENLHFAYRSSPFHQMDGCIISARFRLYAKEEARKDQLAIIDYRMKTQPLKEKSIGCIFRNPVGRGAGALIDECGLKGISFGGAKVSELHANFIVNTGSAKASDVLALIAHIQAKVAEKTGLRLEPEIRVIP
jgi:UDP-N-acetylmuramate dehydrogenase